MSAAETAHLRRSYHSYLITDERARPIERVSSMDQALSSCLARARAGRDPRFLIYGETSSNPATRRTVLLSRWIPPWFPAATPAERLTMASMVETGESKTNTGDSPLQNRNESPGKQEKSR